MGQSTVSTILHETCEIIATVLSKDFVRAPSSAAEWEKISKEFEQRWNFPNCVGMYLVFSDYYNLLISLFCRSN